MTTPGFNRPIPIEYNQVQGGETLVDPPIQTGKSYARGSDTGAWEDLATYDCNACLRGRVTSGAAGQPDITVSPTSFDKTLPPNTTQGYTLTIGNTGNADLSYNISDGECAWLSESPTSGSVQAGNSATITITIDTTGLAEGDCSAEIGIASNDPDEDPLTVPVTLHVVVEDENNPSLATGFASILDRLEIAYGYKSGEGMGGWTFYNPDWAAYPGLNTLNTLYKGRGYWIKVSEACTLTYGDNSYSLDAGWNLIGWVGW